MYIYIIIPKLFSTTLRYTNITAWKIQHFGWYLPRKWKHVPASYVSLPECSPYSIVSMYDISLYMGISGPTISPYFDFTGQPLKGKNTVRSSKTQIHTLRFLAAAAKPWLLLMLSSNGVDKSSPRYFRCEKLRKDIQT